MNEITREQVSWVIEEPVIGRRVEGRPELRVTCCDSRCEHSVDIAQDANGLILFNGVYVDLDEDFMAYVATLEELDTYGFSEPYDEEK